MVGALIRDVSGPKCQAPFTAVTERGIGATQQSGIRPTTI